MVEAWYMDESQEDQRTPHRQRPNRAVSLEQLRRLGVVYRRVGLGVYGMVYCRVYLEHGGRYRGPGRAGRPAGGGRRAGGRGRLPVSLWQLPCSGQPAPALPAPRDSHACPEFRL